MYGLLDSFGDGAASAFRIRGGLAVAAAEAGGGGEVLGDGVQLIIGIGGAGGVVEVFGLFYLPPQVAEPAFAFGFGLAVQNGISTIESDGDETGAFFIEMSVCDGSSGHGWRIRHVAEKFADMEFSAGRAKQQGEALQAARAFQQGGVALVGNRPEIVAPDK